MPKDNTLGAPTEGLGQTVTFAANGQGGSPQAQGANRQALRVGGSGGEARLTAMAHHIPAQQEDKTLSAFMKLGGALLKPKIEEERTAAYARGIQRAMQGEAIAEIVDEQPWYSKIFGSTSLVDGARAQTAGATAAAQAAKLEADMPKLRKLTAEEFTKHTAKLFNEVNTGDSATDAMVTQQLVQQLPSVMKGQAKAHLRYQQETLDDTTTARNDSQFALLGQVDAAARNDASPRDGNDVLATGIATLDLFKPLGDMDKDHHDKLLASSAVKAIQSGNFAVWDILQSGKLDDMHPATAQQVRVAHHRASTESKLKASAGLLEEVAEFRSMAPRGVRPADILAAAKAIDTKYTKMTGDKTSYLGASTLAELTQLHAFNDAEERRLRNATANATTKAGKEAAELQERGALAARVVTGDGDRPYLMLGLQPKEQQQAFDDIRVKADPITLARVHAQQLEVAVDKVAKERITANIGLAEQSGSATLFHEIYQKDYLPYLQVGGDSGAAVAEVYMGKYGEKMAYYHSLARGNEVTPEQQQVYYNETVVTPRGKPVPETDRSKKLAAALKVPKWKIGTYQVRDLEGLKSLIIPKTKAHLEPEAAVREALANTPNLTQLAGYHWTRGVRSSSLPAWVAKTPVPGGVNTKTLEDDLDDTASAIAKEAGIEGDFKVGQMDDSPNGEPLLYVIGTGSDEHKGAKIRVFLASEMSKRKLTYEKVIKEDPFTKTPQLPRSKAPAYYDTPEKMEAYKKTLK